MVTMQTSLFFNTNLLVLLWACTAAIASEPVGGVDVQTGAGIIAREGKEVPSQLKSEIFMDDLISSKDGDIGITFVDNTVVAISPGSELTVDDFVYDPNNADKSKLGVNVVSGTVRYASGAIAHQNNQNVAINTPTATIAVRGTNFTATVDEIGRSQVILLPNIDGSVGKIIVSNMGGSVTLSEAFQSVVVQSLEKAPSEPKILRNLTPQDINNMIIIKPPKEMVDDYMHTVKNALDIDWLAFDELKQDLLNDPSMLANSELSIKPLNVDFLQNVLDAEAAAFAAELKALLDGFTRDGNVAGYNDQTQVTTVLGNDGSRMVNRTVFHVAQLSLEPDQHYTINIKQDGLNIPAKIGITDGAKINVSQSQ